MSMISLVLVLCKISLQNAVHQHSHASTVVATQWQCH